MRSGISVTIMAVVLSAAAGPGCKAPAYPPGCRAEDVAQGLGLALPAVEPNSTLASPAPTAAWDSEFVITRETMRDALFHHNLTLLAEINQVHAAKDEIGVARGNLLPSLSLTQLLYSAGSPVFALSAVETLLPFLAPSNWFAYFQNVALWKAEIVALRSLKLNLLASGLGMYATLASDARLVEVYEAEAADLRQVADEVADAYHAGLATEEELLLAKAQLAASEYAGREIRELVASEVAAVRHALGAPVTTVLRWEDWSIPESSYEDEASVGAIASVTDSAVAIGPEALQLEYLAKAAKMQKWSAVFSFISGAAASGTPSSAFSDLAVGVSAGIGFGYLPTIKLTQRNLTELDLRVRELKQETTEVVESTFEFYRGALERAGLAREMERSARAYYETQHAQYAAGMETLATLLQARSKWRQASVKILEAESQLAQMRITLHRLMLTGDFAGVDSCDLSALDQVVE